ncbi:MAG: VTT domain-containing protein [Actinomycetota bacterium]|nr:VTT domain-containing protein [Actinomycetota bacterium]
MSADDDDLQEHDRAETRPRPSRRTLVLLVAPIVVLTTMGTIATALTPTLAANHPLLLIAMDARNRFLVLAREVDLVPFVVVAVVRRSLSDPLFYLLGRFYGEGAIRWLEKKGGGGELVNVTERIFKRAGYPMVFAFPGAIVCALAGTTGMSFTGFLIANLAGTLTSVIAVRIFSDAISSPVEALLGFFERNMVATTAVSVTLVVLSLVLNRAQGRLEGTSVDALEKELEAGDGTTSGGKAAPPKSEDRETPGRDTGPG